MRGHGPDHSLGFSNESGPEMASSRFPGSTGERDLRAFALPEFLGDACFWGEDGSSGRRKVWDSELRRGTKKCPVESLSHGVQAGTTSSTTHLTP